MTIRPMHRLLARHTPKPLRPLAYRFLYPRLLGDFALDPGLFAGKHVLILGPARTVESDLAGMDPDGFDLVVRMNNGLDTPVQAMGSDPYRCEVLFHSLTADIRPVTAEALRRAGVRTLVHRIPKRSTFLRTIAFRDGLDEGIDLRVVPVDRYEDLSRQLGGFSPTTGLVCTSAVLNAAPQSLAICGFTFFRTRYVRQYDDADGSDDDSMRRVRAKGHHAPDREAPLMMEMVGQARARGIDVILGSGVEQAAADVARSDGFHP